MHLFEANILEELSEFANGKPIEYGEIYDVHGNSLVDLIVGDDGSIPISWQEIKVLVDNYGALILIHTHHPFLIIYILLEI